MSQGDCKLNRFALGLLESAKYVCKNLYSDNIKLFKLGLERQAIIFCCVKIASLIII